MARTPDRTTVTDGDARENLALIRRLGVLSLVEAVTLLILLFVAVPLKHGFS